MSFFSEWEQIIKTMRTRTRQRRDEPIEEKAKRIGVPVLPPREPIKPQESNPVVAVCGECGVEIRKCMMMSCSNPRCPVQRKDFTL